MSVCCHEDVKVPNFEDKIYKDECTQCFDSEDGVFVCLNCFNGSCLKHAQIHRRIHGHSMFLNIQKNVIEKEKHDEGKPVELEVKSEEIEYEYEYILLCLECEETLEIDDVSPIVKQCVHAIKSCDSAERKARIEAWKPEEILPCPHTLDEFVQTPRVLDSKGLAHCEECVGKETSSNLWLCLICGHLGCGRKQFGSDVEGNEHAIQHFKETGHSVVVKMGTITPEGDASVHCYACDNVSMFNYGDIKDPRLASHLQSFGINVEAQTKTEKTIEELSFDAQDKVVGLNSDTGEQLTRRHGIGHVGLNNLGNSCYMASLIQCLVRIPMFSEKILSESDAHENSCKNLPATCFQCQIGKVMNALLTLDNHSDGSACCCVRPTQFKLLAANGEADFIGGQQQDAEHYYHHFMNFCKENEHYGTDSTRFEERSKFKCTSCGGIELKDSELFGLNLPVPYIREVDSQDEDEEPPTKKSKANVISGQSVTLDSLLECWMNTEEVEKLCKCGCETFRRQNGFANFPETLVVCLGRTGYHGGDWVPRKLDSSVLFNCDDTLDLSCLAAKGLQDGEHLVEFVDDSVEIQIVPDDLLLVQLVSMGFNEEDAKRALIAVENIGAEEAMTWLFDNPSPPTSTAFHACESFSSDDDVQTLLGLGFSVDASKVALTENNQNVEASANWLFMHPDPSSLVFVSPSETINEVETKHISIIDERPPNYKLFAAIHHKGSSTHSGHYVAYIRDGNDATNENWLLYNDSEVLEHPSPPLDKAYMLFYRKV